MSNNIQETSSQMNETSDSLCVITKKIINKRLLYKVPLDVIINVIIPFTYEIIPKCLISDIVSYTRDKNLVESVFYTEYNPFILANELLCFCNKNMMPIYYLDKMYCAILSRHFMLSKKSTKELYHYAFHRLHNNLYRNPEKMIRILWGLLNPSERKLFTQMNIYTAEDRTATKNIGGLYN